MAGNGKGFVLSVDKAQGKVIVKGNNGDVIQEESIDGIPVVTTESHFKLAYGLERKMSDGNYGSAGFFVSLSAPTTADDLEGDFEEVKAWVENKAGEISAEMKTALADSKKG